MKYFTQKWLQNTMNTGLFLPLDAKKKAGKFSEEYFQKLYQCKLIKFIEQEKLVHVFQKDPEYTSVFVDFGGDMSDPAASFAEMYEFKLSNIKQYLPDNIRRNIADIRVLALNTATWKNKVRIEWLARKERMAMEKPFKEYRAYYKRNRKKLEKHFNEDFNLHDEIIPRMYFQGSDFVMDIESEFDEMNPCQLIFQNAKIVKSAGDFIRAYWKYDEIYLEGNSVEMHIAIGAEISEDDETPLEPADMIIQASYIQFIHENVK